MASYTLTAATTHKTLVATVADTATLAGGYSTVSVINRDATNDIYFRADGTTAAVGADGTYIAKAGVYLPVTIPVQLLSSGAANTVSLISAGAPAYSLVCGLEPRTFVAMA